MELYTIAELSKILNIPESTIRYYRDRHQDYFYPVGTGKKKRYPPETITVLRLISEGARESRKAEHIAKVLEVRFNKQPPIAKTESVETQTLTGNSPFQLPETLTTAIKEISDIKKEIQGLRDEIKELREYIKPRHKKNT